MGTVSLAARAAASVLAAAVVVAGLVVLVVDDPGASVVVRRAVCTVVDEERTAELEAQLTAVLAGYDPDLSRVGSCRNGADVAVEATLRSSTTAAAAGTLPRPRPWRHEVEDAFVAHGWVDDGALRSADGRYQLQVWVTSEDTSWGGGPSPSLSLTVTIFLTGRTHFGAPD
ncbi:hypothetical protein [Nocardioides taihuensis]|uniref:Uncharacterized protein n=1 Tax=Nocardioides taihuensis TaxID=1835606 RepID=A0ABW0BIR2_9ACTN